MTQRDFLNFEEQHIYVAPAVSVHCILTEGVLCSSLDRADAGYDPEFDLGEI